MSFRVLLCACSRQACIVHVIRMGEGLKSEDVCGLKYEVLFLSERFGEKRGLEIFG